MLSVLVISKRTWAYSVIIILAFGILFLYHRSCAYEHLVSSNLLTASFDVLNLLACAFLLNRFLIPNLLYKRKLITFGLSLSAMVVFFSNVILFSQWYLAVKTNGNIARANALLKDFFYQLFTIYLVIILGCLCIIILRLLLDQMLSQRRYIELQKEKAQTELRFLVAQINPHFLFNSINSIFAHIDKQNNKAREIVLKFSDMLRYQLYECTADEIDFEREFFYLNNFIELQRLRKGDNFEIVLEKKGDLKGFSIAPLLLVPFVENAIKYVSNYEEKRNSVKVVVQRESKHFSFQCTNTRDRVVSREILEMGGIGISNVRRRLELLYPARHELRIQDDHSTFDVKLTLVLT